MKSDETQQDSFVELRRLANESLQNEPSNLSEISLEDTNSLLHELQVHQTELEMQNEELRRIQKELEESRNRYSILYDFAPVGYFTIDKNGIICEANLTGANLLGIERGFLIGKPLSHFINREDQDSFYFHRKQVFETKERQICEVRLVRKDDSQFYIQLESIVMHNNGSEPDKYQMIMSEINNRKLAESVANITKTKQAEEALRKHDQIYRSVISTTGGVPYIKDFINDGYEFIGEGIQSLTGFPAEEFNPELMESLVQERIDLKICTEPPNEDTLSILKTEKPTYLLQDLRIKTRYGEERWLSDSSVQIHNEQGKLIKTLGILQNITERKNAEKKLRDSNLRLEEALTELRATQHQIIQQERIRALGQLASGITHEFNNVLTPILGYSDMLLRVPNLLKDEGRVYRNLKTINIAALDAKNISSRLQEFYRQSEADDNFRLIDLNDLIHQAVQLTEPKWKAQAQAKGNNISITTDLQEIPHVMGIGVELREVLINLIFNSVDALFTDGTISLKTRSEETDVVIEVADTGIGMTEEIKKQCFKFFFSTKGSGGSGLGLSVIHSIIRKHHGTIDVESEEGKGTTFIIHLPVSKETRYQESDQEVEIPLQPLHVLVVDDNPLIQETLSEYLTYDGHNFMITNNGFEALEKLKLNSFDLVITDRAMPNMGGDQLAAIVKQSNPNMSLIMITGFGDIMSVIGETPKHIDYLLSKPMTLDALRKALLKVSSSVTSN
jgi:PAS domain S-box-containing protein